MLSVRTAVSTQRTSGESFSRPVLSTDIAPRSVEDAGIPASQTLLTKAQAIFKSGAYTQPSRD